MSLDSRSAARSLPQSLNRVPHLLLTLLALLVLGVTQSWAAERDTPWRVAEIYIATMGYAPDSEGLDYWVNNIQTLSQWTPTTVAQSFFDQPLVQAEYPSALGDGPLIEALYTNIFGRDPDAEGYAYWLSELEAGRVQRNQMIIALIEGGWANPDAEEDMARFGNRVEVALAFSDYQRQNGILYSQLSEIDQASLRAVGREVLEGVGAGAADATTAIAGIPDLLSSFVGKVAAFPVKVQLVGASSLSTDSIQLDWLTTTDAGVQTEALRYRLHASQVQSFVPDDTTAREELVGSVSGTITGLQSQTLYYVKVEVIRETGENGWSNELAATTAGSDPVETLQPRRVLDDTNAPNQSVTDDTLSFDLRSGDLPPNPGELLVSSEGTGYLRRALAVTEANGQVTVTTERANLGDLFEQFELATEIKLIEPPEQAQLAGHVVGRSLQVTQSASASTTRREAVWPDNGLLLFEERPIPTAEQRAAERALGIVSASAASSTETKADGPLKITYPAVGCTEPNKELEVIAKAKIASGASFEITSFESTLSAPSWFFGLFGEKITDGVDWQLTKDGDWTGNLTWTPSEEYVNNEGDSYTLQLTAKAEDPDCWVLCTKTYSVDIPIYVASSCDLPSAKQATFGGSATNIVVSGSSEISFSPEFSAIAEKKSEGADEDYVKFTISGPISFNTKLQMTATSEAEYRNTKKVLEKGFVKIISVGGMPVLVSGKLNLDLQFTAKAEGALDLRQTLEVGFNIDAGLEYKDGDFSVIQDAIPWQKYELSGEANAHAYVELRFIPRLDVSFYEIASGTLQLEPYLYGETGLEGHFLYQILNDNGDVLEGSDADFRFTKLEIGGGVDAAFGAGLEFFGWTAIGYPGGYPDELKHLTIIDKQAFMGLPDLEPFVTNEYRGCLLGLDATVSNMPNPFYPLGSETFNPFSPESAAWQVVLGSNNATITADADGAWFSAAESGDYQVRFSGHSELGSFVRQYEELSISYDRPADCEEVNQWLLTVDTQGTGAGTITSTPAGISCPGNCSMYVADGTQVTLTAIPEAGSSFTGWGDVCSGSSAQCVLDLSFDQSVLATFSMSKSFFFEDFEEGVGDWDYGATAGTECALTTTSDAYDGVVGAKLDIANGYCYISNIQSIAISEPGEYEVSVFAKAESFDAVDHLTVAVWKSSDPVTDPREFVSSEWMYGVTGQYKNFLLGGQWLILDRGDYIRLEIGAGSEGRASKVYFDSIRLRKR